MALRSGGCEFIGRSAMNSDVSSSIEGVGAAACGIAATVQPARFARASSNAWCARSPSRYARSQACSKRTTWTDQGYRCPERKAPLGPAACCRFASPKPHRPGRRNASDAGDRKGRIRAGTSRAQR